MTVLRDDPLRFSALALCIAMPLLFGVAAILMPQDNNWDLRNYHWYNAYAVLTGRMGFDMGPAQTPSFYNPLLDIPFFLAAEVLPARVIAFLLGVIHGCNFILLFVLARLTLTFGSESARLFAAGGVAAIGMIGAGHLGVLGTTFYDNVISLFFLGALVIVLASKNVLVSGALRPAFARVALAGALVGLAVGFKLTAQVFAVGVCFGLLFIPGAFMRRFWLSFVCGLGVIAGFAVTGGWWIARMWTTFRNPLFPYMNDVFRSPWALAESYRDTRFLQDSPWDALTFPFRFAADSSIAGETSFTDLRLAVAYTVLAVTAIILLVRRRWAPESMPGADLFAARYLCAAAGLTYAAWLAVFAIYRYIIALEMLAPLLTVTAVALWPVRAKVRAAVAVVLLLLVAVTVKPTDWGNIPWAGGAFVKVQPPVIADPAATIVLMAGFAPTSFIIPAFPPEVAFLRPQSYLVAPTHDTRFRNEIAARIKAHTGEILLVQPEWESWAAKETLPQFGLAADLAGCRPLPTNLDSQLQICPVLRQP